MKDDTKDMELNAARLWIYFAAVKVTVDAIRNKFASFYAKVWKR